MSTVRGRLSQPHMQYSTNGLESAIQAEPAMQFHHQVTLYLHGQDSKSNTYYPKAQTNKASLIPRKLLSDTTLAGF